MHRELWQNLDFLKNGEIDQKDHPEPLFFFGELNFKTPIPKNRAPNSLHFDIITATLHTLYCKTPEYPNGKSSDILTWNAKTEINSYLPPDEFLTLEFRHTLQIILLSTFSIQLTQKSSKVSKQNATARNLVFGKFTTT